MDRVSIALHNDVLSLGLIVIVASLTANTHVIHLWIEEDLIYTNMCQAFKFYQ